MHVRLSLILGMPVHEEGSRLPIARLDLPIINVDTGKIEAFFVLISGGFLPARRLVLPVADIARFGARVTVRSSEVFCEPTDVIRIASLLSDSRRLLQQRMQTVSGVYLGRAADVQFETLHFMLQWIFPRRWYGWGTPVSTSSVLEVTPQAVIVRDAVVPDKSVSSSVLLTKAPEPSFYTSSH